MLLKAIKVHTLLIENRSVVDISQLVRLNRIGDDILANLGLLAIHAEIETLEHLLKDVGNLLHLVLIVAKYAIVIAITDYLIRRRDAGTLDSLMKQEIGIAEHYLSHKVEDAATLWDTDVATLLQRS